MKQNMAVWHRLIYGVGGGGLAAWALTQDPVRGLLAGVGVVGVIEGLLGF